MYIKIVKYDKYGGEIEKPNLLRTEVRKRKLKYALRTREVVKLSQQRILSGPPGISVIKL